MMVYAQIKKTVKKKSREAEKPLCVSPTIFLDEFMLHGVKRGLRAV
jgi:hypothetical protein